MTRLVLFVLLFGAQNVWALDCSHLKGIVARYLKEHIKFKKFDDSLSQRTLENLFKFWDPSKYYLLQKDVDILRKRYSNRLDNQVDNYQSSKCKALDDIVNIYSLRFQKINSQIVKIITAKHDFTVDEYFVFNRDSYAKDHQELSERWRKRIKFQLLQLKTSLGDLKKAQQKLSKRYQLIAKRHNELTTKDVYTRFLRAFAMALDPHSDYLPSEQLEDFQIRNRLSLEGIGAVLRSEEGFTTIQSLVPGGAAEKSGLLQANDKIINVAQAKGEAVDIIDMDLREVVKLIRGKPGTKVHLTILREHEKGTQRSTITIVREKIMLKDQEASAKIYQTRATGQKRNYQIGVITLPSFYRDFNCMNSRNKSTNCKSSTKDVQTKIRELKKIDALVLDLRRNPGGSLDEAISLTGLFITDGPVVQVKKTGQKTKVYSDDDKNIYYRGPLVVLIDRYSASASEIVAGAIQDHTRGLIVGGDHTFGKGSVQNLSVNDPYRGGGALKATISKFYLPAGASTQSSGVVSDIILPSIVNELEIGEKHNEYALEWERIKKLNYRTIDRTTPYLKQLAAASSSRLANDKSFKEITEGIAKYKKELENRTRISLKEKPQETNSSSKVKKENDQLTIADDAHLQETLRIASDYLRLLSEQKLSPVTIVEMKK